MKLYTKTGDQGTTSVIGGARLLKNDARINAYGTLDEVNSWLGLIISELGESSENTQLKVDLTKIQVLLFDCGTDFATIDGAKDYIVTTKEVAIIENWIDRYSEQVPPLTQFILPGGTATASKLQIVRTVIRRAERELVSLIEQEVTINMAAYQIINRLSDLFFAMARFVNSQADVAEPGYHSTFKNLLE